jgi:D-alanine-D-alanine ligase
MGYTVGVLYNLKRENGARFVSESGGFDEDDDEPPDSDAEYDSESTVCAVVEALKEAGHQVVCIEGNERFLETIHHVPIDIAFNMCEGICGESRESHIPAILEMLGIPYTGSGVLSLALSLDKPAAKRMFEYSGVNTPQFEVFPPGVTPIGTSLKFPCFVKPAHEGSSMGITPSSRVDNEFDLVKEVARIHRLYKQEALVEEYIDGRELTVGILGNEDPIFLPIMEINFDPCPDPHKGIYSRLFKAKWSDDLFYLCPAPLSEEVEYGLRSLALSAFHALGCRDVARVDIRIDRSGSMHVLEVNPLPGLSPGYSDLPRMAEAGGIDYVTLVNMILNNAIERLAKEGRKPFSTLSRVPKQVMLIGNAGVRVS